MIALFAVLTFAAVLYAKRLARELGLRGTEFAYRGAKREEILGAALAPIGAYALSAIAVGAALALLGRAPVRVTMSVLAALFTLWPLADAVYLYYVSKRIGWGIGKGSAIASSSTMGIALALALPVKGRALTVVSPFMALSYALILVASAGGYAWYARRRVGRT